MVSNWVDLMDGRVWPADCDLVVAIAAECTIVTTLADRSSGSEIGRLSVRPCTLGDSPKPENGNSH